MEIKFDFVIEGAGEAVFWVNKEHKIYSIKGVNSLHEKYANDEQILSELNIVRAALFDDATLPVR
jgi:hypothetical protein